MKSIFTFTLIIIMTFTSCKKEIDYSNLQPEDIENIDFDPDMMDISTNEDVEIYHEATGKYPDGTYCAEIEYYNPSTGTRNRYDLDVEVESGDLTIINWPNGGWLDDTHFVPENISSGEVQFTSDMGNRYTVTLGDFGGGCYSGGVKLRNAVNNDIGEQEFKRTEETCPECGGSKFSTDDLCSSCERKITCPNCGGRKGKYDELCYTCEIAKQDEEHDD